MRLEGITAIVTGAASGFGRASAERFAEEGADVALADINAAGLQATADRVEALGRRALIVPCDVSKRENVQALVDATVATFGKLDVLFANAGVLESIPFLELTDAAWHTVLSVNLGGVFLCDQIAARQMVAQGTGGAIVNTSSQLAESGASRAVAYGASKAAVMNLTKSAAVALAPHGIRVNAIQPGPIATGLTAAIHANPVLSRYNAQFVRSRRPGDVRDVANAALYLASEESGWMTGQSLIVDGGWLLNATDGTPEYQDAVREYSAEFLKDWQERGLA